MMSLTSSRSRADLQPHLLPQSRLEGIGILGELLDSLSKLLSGHLIFCKITSEGRLVIEIRLRGDVQRGSILRLELPGDGLLRLGELIEESGLHVSVCWMLKENTITLTYRDGQAIAASKLGDLALVAE
jgi:hypothetical protein